MNIPPWPSDVELSWPTLVLQGLTFGGDVGNGGVGGGGWVLSWEEAGRV